MCLDLTRLTSQNTSHLHHPATDEGWIAKARSWVVRHAISNQSNIAFAVLPTELVGISLMCSHARACPACWPCHCLPLGGARSEFARPG